MAQSDGSAWEEEDDEPAPPPDVPYYNNFPGKQPPPGGLIDMRTRPGATLVRWVHMNTTRRMKYTHTHASTHPNTVSTAITRWYTKASADCGMCQKHVGFEPRKLKGGLVPVIFHTHRCLLTPVTRSVGQRINLLTRVHMMQWLIICFCATVFAALWTARSEWHSQAASAASTRWVLSLPACLPLPPSLSLIQAEAESEWLRASFRNKIQRLTYYLSSNLSWITISLNTEHCSLTIKFVYRAAWSHCHNL